VCTADLSLRRLPVQESSSDWGASVEGVVVEAYLNKVGVDFFCAFLAVPSEV